MNSEETRYVIRFVSDVGAAVNALNQVAIAAEKSAEKTSAALNKTKKSGDDTTSSFVINATRFDVFLRKATVAVARWAVATTLVYGSVRAFQGAVGVIAEVDAKMHDLQTVTDRTTTSYVSLLKEGFGLAKTFGRDIGTVLDMYREWGRQGKAQHEILNLTRASLLAANVGYMEQTESVGFVTAALKQFKLESSAALAVVDSWAHVADKYATSFRDIAAGTAKAGALLAQYGDGVHYATAVITAMTETTRVSGEEAGTALREMMRHLYRPEAAKTLAEIGVYLKDANGEFRKTSDILGDLALKWENLDSSQRQAIQYAIGKRRQAFVVNLMENYATVLEAVTHSMDSQGSAMLKNSIMMDAYSRNVNQLKASVQELAYRFGEGGLLRALTDTVNVGAGVVSFFNWLPPVFINSTVAATGMIAAFKGLGAAFKGLSGVTVSGGKPFQGFKGWAQLGGPKAMAIAAGLGVLGGIATSMQQANKAAQQRINEVLGLRDAHTALTAKTERTVSEQQKLQTILNAAGDLVPELITGFDELGNVIGIAWAQMKKTPVEDATKQLHDLERQIDRINAAIWELTSPDTTMVGDILVTRDTQTVATKLMQLNKQKRELHTQREDALRGEAMREGEENWDTFYPRMIRTVASAFDILKHEATLANQAVALLAAQEGRLADAFARTIPSLGNANAVLATRAEMVLMLKERMTGLNAENARLTGLMADVDAAMMQKGWDYAEAEDSLNEVQQKQYRELVTTYRDLEAQLNNNRIAQEQYRQAIDTTLASMRDMEQHVLLTGIERRLQPTTRDVSVTGRAVAMAQARMGLQEGLGGIGLAGEMQHALAEQAVALTAQRIAQAAAIDQLSTRLAELMRNEALNYQQIEQVRGALEEYEAQLHETDMALISTEQNSQSLGQAFLRQSEEMRRALHLTAMLGQAQEAFGSIQQELSRSLWVGQQMYALTGGVIDDTEQQVGYFESALRRTLETIFDWEAQTRTLTPEVWGLVAALREAEELEEAARVMEDLTNLVPSLSALLAEQGLRVQGLAQQYKVLKAEADWQARIRPWLEWTRQTIPDARDVEAGVKGAFVRGWDGAMSTISGKLKERLREAFSMEDSPQADIAQAFMGGVIDEVVSLYAKGMASILKPTIEKEMLPVMEALFGEAAGIPTEMRLAQLGTVAMNLTGAMGEQGLTGVINRLVPGVQNLAALLGFTGKGGVIYNRLPLVPQAPQRIEPRRTIGAVINIYANDVDGVAEAVQRALNSGGVLTEAVNRTNYRGY